MLKRFTLFQITMMGLVGLCLILQVGVIILLLRTRSEARDIVERSDHLVALADQGPYVERATLEALLGWVAVGLNDLADERIRYTFRVSQTLPFAIDVPVDAKIAVPVSLTVSHTLALQTEIPFREQLYVPVDLEIDQILPVDFSVPFQDEFVVPIDEVIYIDEDFETRVLGARVGIPIRGNIPVRLDVRVPIDTQIPVRADVPVRFSISETLPVKIERTIPIDLDVPVHLPLQTTVVVPLNRTIPIRAQIPLRLDVPVDIMIDETPLGALLRAE